MPNPPQPTANVYGDFPSMVIKTHTVDGYDWARAFGSPSNLSYGWMADGIGEITFNKTIGYSYELSTDGVGEFASAEIGGGYFSEYFSVSNGDSLSGSYFTTLSQTYSYTTLGEHMDKTYFNGIWIK